MCQSVERGCSDTHSSRLSHAISTVLPTLAKDPRAASAAALLADSDTATLTLPWSEVPEEP